MFGKMFGGNKQHGDHHDHDHHHGDGEGSCGGGGCCGACACGGHAVTSCRLDEARFGARCRIKRLHGQGAIRQRLLDLGIVPNVEIMVVRSAPLNDPIELRIGDAFVTVRRTEARHIEVEYV